MGVRFIAPTAAAIAWLGCAGVHAQEPSAAAGLAGEPVTAVAATVRGLELKLAPVSPATLGLPSPAVAAGAAAGSAAARKPRSFVPLEQHFDASVQGPAPRTIVLGQHHDLRIILPDELRPSEAFQAELRRKTLGSNRAQHFANLPYDMPELLEDDYINEQRASVAKSVMGSAVEKALIVAFQGGVRHESSVVIRPRFATVDHGFKVDASPTWSYKVRTARSGLRFDLPLTPRPLRVHAWRDLQGTDRTPVRFGGGLTLDPFDQSVRCGFSLEF